MAFNARQAFFGSTPERLWRRRGALLRTEAGGDRREPSGRREGAATGRLVDERRQKPAGKHAGGEDICQRLQSEASTLDVLPPQVVRLRKVQHLRRCIWTELAAPDDSRCLLQLQPTAAVAGPRRAALAFIQRHEPFSANGTPGPPGICHWRKASFAWRCVRRK